MSDPVAESEDRLVVDADYVCPFCYLGQKSLEEYRATRDEPLDVAWHPYDLRGRERESDGEIDDSVEDGEGEGYFDRMHENVARLREQYGAEEMLSIDPVLDVDAFDTQRVSMDVRDERPETWADLDDALFEAVGRRSGRRRFGGARRRRGVGGVADRDRPRGARRRADPRVPVRAVRGGPSRPMSRVSASAARECQYEQFEAAHRDGVTGVPTFVYGEYAARGAVPPAHLRRLVEGD
jgi:predicted DsbA family dithiol-disulfide isomerase